MRAPLWVKLLCIGAVVAACGRTDAPTSANPATQEVLQATDAGPRYTGGYVTTFIECVVTVTSARSTFCGSSSQPYYNGAVRGSLMTQQCAVACLEPLAPTYDAAHGWWAVQLRVRNASSQALGTFDGVTPSSWKTSVVLVEPPRSLAGLGAISVVGPTTRISADPRLPQNTLYSAYPAIIQPYGTSDFRTWTFQVPKSVTRFAFRVVVVADIEPRIKISEVMPGSLSATAPAGMYLEMDNVGTAPIAGTTLVVVDSILETRSTVVASVPIAVTDEWPSRERRIVAAADLAAVLFPRVYSSFPLRYKIAEGRTHRIRVRVGSRTGKVLDELWMDPTFRVAGIGFERAYLDYSNTVTKLYYPAWAGSTDTVRTRCAGSSTCPVLTGSPGKANLR
jgi:hypothetical protein